MVVECIGWNEAGKIKDGAKMPRGVKKGELERHPRNSHISRLFRLYLGVMFLCLLLPPVVFYIKQRFVRI